MIMTSPVISFVIHRMEFNEVWLIHDISHGVNRKGPNRAKHEVIKSPVTVGFTVHVTRQFKFEELVVGLNVPSTSDEWHVSLKRINSQLTANSFKQLFRVSVRWWARP